MIKIGTVESDCETESVRAWRRSDAYIGQVIQETQRCDAWQITCHLGLGAPRGAGWEGWESGERGVNHANASQCSRQSSIAVNLLVFMLYSIKPTQSQSNRFPTNRRHRSPIKSIFQCCQSHAEQKVKHKLQWICTHIVGYCRHLKPSEPDNDIFFNLFYCFNLSKKSIELSIFSKRLSLTQWLEALTRP